MDFVQISRRLRRSVTRRYIAAVTLSDSGPLPIHRAAEIGIRVIKALTPRTNQGVFAPVGAGLR